MDQVRYFKDLLQPISDYKKVVFLNFLINSERGLLTECGFLTTFCLKRFCLFK